MTISIVIPVKPGHEPQALQRLGALDWPAEQFELLVAEGTCPSKQRNQAVQQAQGEIIYFLDDDSLVTHDALRRLERHFEDPRVVVVGGPSLTPPTDTLLQRSFGTVLSSLLGAGGVRNRYRSVGAVRDTTERELILCNLAIRREEFLTNGGLDERLYPNEENELLDRLQKRGDTLLHDPGLVVTRSQRQSIPAFVRQMFRYGRGRAEQTRLAGFQGLMPFMPLVFLVYLLAIPFVSIPWWQLPLVVYIISCLLCALRAALVYREPRFTVLVSVLFPVLHVANGFGLLAGFLLPRKLQTCYKPQPVAIRRLQPVQDPAYPGEVRWT